MFAGQVPAVGAWATLRELVLDECKGLREVTLSLPCLHTISLQSCRTLRSVRPPPPPCQPHLKITGVMLQRCDVIM